MTPKPKLLPCPFCKPPTALYIGVDGHEGNRMVMCEDCGCEGPRMPTEAEAMEAWNTRATPPLSAPVLAFARKMQERLDANAHKGGRENWLKDSPSILYNRLKEEVQELSSAIFERYRIENNRGSYDNLMVTKEAADVANFAMFIADACGGLESEEGK